MIIVHTSSPASRATSAYSCKLALYVADGLCRCSTKNIIPVSTSLLATAQIFRHRTFCTLLILSYLFSLSTGLREREPEMMYFNYSGTSKMSESLFSAERESLPKISMRETDQEGDGGADNSEDNVEYFIRHTTVGPELLVEKSVLHSKNQSNFVHGNTASVIASSFRNIDGQTTNSKEAEEGGEPAVEEPVVRKKPRCQRNSLKKCIDGLPPMNDTGIPTSPEAVNRACRIYDSGISCFDNWAKNCLPPNQRQIVRASITGAHEMYSFLCKDSKFRQDYLKHKECYRQLSPYWDDCSRQFIEGLKKNIRNNYTAFCCVRLEFVTCVSKYSSRLCSYEATKFSMKMAETLIRTRTRPPIPDCLNIHPQNCIPIPSGKAHSAMHHHTFILLLVSVYFSLKLQ